MGSFLDPLKAIILAIGDNSSADEVLTALNSAKAHAAEARELVRGCEEAIIDWIKANGDLNAGPGIRYYVGTEKKQSCKDVGATIEAVLNAVGGDCRRFADSLSSNPFKFGETGKILGDSYSEYFTTTIVSDLKTGKPKPSLNKSDDAYKR